MTDDLIELARRAVWCKSWRWMPGMLCVPGEGMMGVPRRLTDDADWPHDLGMRFPVLTDPATLGCLLALVRVAYADPYASVWYSSDHNHSGDRWSYYSKAFTFSGHATEAEALVVALESAL